MAQWRVDRGFDLYKRPIQNHRTGYNQRQIKYTGENVLALEILRPFNPNKHDGDLAIDYADWIHYPPDYNGGIVNNVEIKTYDQVGHRIPL